MESKEKYTNTDAAAVYYHNLLFLVIFRCKNKGNQKRYRTVSSFLEQEKKSPRESSE